MLKKKKQKKLEYNTLDVLFPNDLGEINHLRDHPMILQKLIEISEDNSLNPFIENYYANKSMGGFEWGEEGIFDEDGTTWGRILSGGEGFDEGLKTFYEKY